MDAVSTSSECVHHRKRAKTVSPDRSPAFCRTSYRGYEGRVIHVVSVICAMKHQERTVYKQSHYLENVGVTALDRMDLCKWGFGIVDACNIDRKVATIAITYFDRFLSCRRSSAVDMCLAERRELQLAFITCIIIALKCLEGIDANANFIANQMCEGMYYPEELIDMEVEVLRALGFRLNGPCPQDYIEHFIELLPPSTDETIIKVFHKEATKNAEAAMMDYNMALKPPSSIALSSFATFVKASGFDTLTQIDITGWLNCIEYLVRN